MAGMLNLKPEVGSNLANGFSMTLDGELLDAVAEAFAAAKELGEGTAMFDGVKANFMKFQDYYNNTVVPEVRKAQGEFEEYTDMATYLTQLNVSDSVKEEDVGRVTSKNFDACKAL